MQPIILRIPIAHLGALDARPLTRERVIGIAHRLSVEAPREVHIVLTVEHDDDWPAIEIASVELNSTPDGGWRLQYVSHPAQSSGLTASIHPCTSDFVAFLQARQTTQMPQTLTPLCADELDDEGLGPLAALNLRLENPAPVVPSQTDLDLLLALSRLAPCSQRRC